MFWHNLKNNFSNKDLYKKKAVFRFPGAVGTLHRSRQPFLQREGALPKIPAIEVSLGEKKEEGGGPDSTSKYLRR